ncbi:hypothetical protein L6164_002905 [Bauhinia variegata]|uniref:Uncharacterized protein n=1 Tax=Bauhinia variegata TaxID=167791 RepID=A0ACB9PZM7_BAUVA|nr:hypothetical protein L6164_002905 [Bauhinia variegata]
MSKGNSNNPNTATGKKAALYTKVEVNLVFSNLIVSRMVALNASIVVINEMNRKPNPTDNFLGRELRKSCISNGDVRMERNITTEASELARATTSMIVKKRNIGEERNIGTPLSSLPPGIVYAAVKTTVATRTATVEHD